MCTLFWQALVTSGAPFGPRSGCETTTTAFSAVFLYVGSVMYPTPSLNCHVHGCCCISSVCPALPLTLFKQKIQNEIQFIMSISNVFSTNKISVCLGLEHKSPRYIHGYIHVHLIVGAVGAMIEQLQYMKKEYGEKRAKEAMKKVRAQNNFKILPKNRAPVPGYSS